MPPGVVQCAPQLAPLPRYPRGAVADGPRDGIGALAWPLARFFRKPVSTNAP
jgi:hypothetical protein